MLTHRLRHRIAIQEAVETQDPNTGEMIASWQNVTVNGVELSSYPAEVLTGPGRERHLAGTTQAEATARLTLRWFPGLDPAWRILWEGKVFNIVSIETDAKARREYRLRCIDGLSDGQ